MAIKLILLKSGEDIITDINEMSFGEGDDKRVVGYFLKKPCVVRMDQPEQEDKGGFDVSLFPWMPLTSQEVIPINAEWLITMVEPVEKLRQMFIEDVLNGQDSEDDTPDDPGDTDIGD